MYFLLSASPTTTVGTVLGTLYVAMLFTPSRATLVHHLRHVATILEHVAVGLTASAKFGWLLTGVHVLLMLANCFLCIHHRLLMSL